MVQIYCPKAPVEHVSGEDLGELQSDNTKPILKQ